MAAANATDPAYAAAAAARDAAKQTPEEVRRAMLAGPRECCGVILQPMHLDILWMLEEARNPVAVGTEGRADARLTAKDTAELIFAFAATDEALAASASATQPGAKLSPFSREALAWVRRNICAADGRKLVDAIVEIVDQAFSVAPGAGAAAAPAATAEKKTAEVNGEAKAG